MQKMRQKDKHKESHCKEACYKCVSPGTVCIVTVMLTR